MSKRNRELTKICACLYGC